MGQKASTCSPFVGEPAKPGKPGTDKCGKKYDSKANFCGKHPEQPTTMVPVCWVDGGSAGANLVRFNDGTQTACKTTGSRGDVLLRFNTVPATATGSREQTGLPYCGISRQYTWPTSPGKTLPPKRK